MADPANLENIDGPLGSLFQDDGPPDPDPKDNPKAAGRDQRVAPHVTTFAALLNQFSRSYSYRSDEALKNNAANARYMRNDAFYRALLQERLLPTARRKWKIEVDNPDDPRQKEVQEGLTACVKGIPYFARMRYNLLDAEWYGRYGVQGTWERNPDVRDEAGNALYTFCRPQPVNGDKIQFQWDGTPAVMVSQQHKWPEGSIIYGDRAPMLKLHRPEWRRQFVIHKFNPEDADYFDGDMAGAVNGVGLRSMIYWSWWMREEMLGWCVDFMQKVGTLGLLVFWYEDGNKAAEKKAEDNAKSASNRAAFVMPRPGGKSDMPPGGVEQIAPQTGGIEALQDMIANYWERHQERLIVGQSMSGGKHEGNGEGLGGTGMSEFARDTKYQILAYSAENLDETLTADLVTVAKRLNYPDADFPARFKSVVPDPEAAEKLKNALALLDRVAVAVPDVYEMAGLRQPDPGEPTIGGPLGGVLGPGTTAAPGQPANGGKPLGGLLGDQEPLGGLLGRGASVNGNGHANGKPLGGILGTDTTP